MKARRHAKILELIRTNIIETQEELVESLSRHGIPVTQATISRDIKELQLTKIPVGDGGYRYALPDEQPAGSLDKRRRLFRDSVLGVDRSESLVVIKTLPGTAPGVGSAIDHFNWPEVIGSVAGDDTVLVIVKPATAAGEVIDRLKDLMS
ncbi:MAG TPA: arginine repressor [Symbiobacteriaceae bacterium]|nr:arginine repressor [Symbiobacteriaceae bacterium]